jgi:hypothetical protein
MLGGRAADMNNPYSFVVTMNIAVDNSPPSGFGNIPHGDGIPTWGGTPGIVSQYLIKIREGSKRKST